MTLTTSGKTRPEEFSMTRGSPPLLHFLDSWWKNLRPVGPVDSEKRLYVAPAHLVDNTIYGQVK